MKEEPLSEEDLRAVQKDRQKKDNHNMSKNAAFLCLLSFTIISSSQLNEFCTHSVHVSDA